MSYTPPRETLAATVASRLISKALAACVVLAHPHAVFHPYTCGLCGSAAAVATALIGYNVEEVVATMTTRKRRS
jgi:hypothetical protein